MTPSQTIFMLLFALLAMATTATALDISDYPQIFVHGDTFDPEYVIGEEAPSMDVVSATILSTAITDYEVKIGTSKLDSEINDVKKINAIVIGNPCVNKAAAQLEGDPLFCYKGLEGGKGYAKLFSNNGKYQLLITGVSAEDRKAMAEYLAKNYLGNIKTKTFLIDTGTGSKTPKNPFAQQQTNKAATETTKKEIEEEKSNHKSYEKENSEEKKKTEKETMKETKKETEKTTQEDEKKTEKNKQENNKEEPKEKKGFFAKVFEAIGSFFKYLFG